MDRTCRTKFDFFGAAAETLAWCLAALLPVKFSSIVSVPEMPSSYWFDAASLIFVVWPNHLFSLLSSLLLLLTLAAPGAGREGTRSLRSVPVLWCLLWGSLAVLSAFGLVHASCPEYAFQMISHAFGTGCFILSVFLLLERRPGFRRALLCALLVGGSLAALSGYRQYFSGFDELQEHVAEQSRRLGGDAVNSKLLTRIRERRLQGDFPSCNTYGGYLAMMLPILFGLLWKFGSERVEPKKAARWILALPVLPVLLFLIFATRSRGAVLSLIFGAAVLFFALPLSRRIKILFLAASALGLAALTAVILFSDRGGGSLVFRADYNWAGFRMMAEHPLFGTGWGDFFHDYQRMKLLVNDEAPHTPHNMISLFGSQCGILAFLNAAVLLFLPLIFLFRRLRKDPPSAGDILPFALFCSVAVATADFMFEITYETPAFLCTYAIVVLLAFRPSAPSGAEASLPEAAPDRSARRARLLLRCGLALFALFSAAAAFLMILDEQAFAEFQETMDPRYSRTYMDPGTYRPPSHDKVVRLLDRAVSRGPYNPFPWATAAGYMAFRKDHVAAEKYMDEAIRRSPLRSSFYLRRAKIRHAAQADPALVKADLEKVRELFPMNNVYQDAPDEVLLQSDSPQ